MNAVYAVRKQPHRASNISNLQEHANASTNSALFWNDMPLLNVVKNVISNGRFHLSVAFKIAFPNQRYKTDIALSRLLQMPLVCIKQKVWFLFELVEGVDYIKFVLEVCNLHLPSGSLKS